MNEIMSYLIPLVGVLIGALVTLVTTRLTIQQNQQAEREKVNIEKLEELHRAVTQLKEAYRTYMASVLYGGENRKYRYIPIDQIRMLVQFYAPDAQTELVLLEQAQHEFGSIAASIEVAASHRDFTSDWVQEHKEKVGPAFSNIETACNALQSKVSSLFRKRVKI